ncbi:uncharacterized protein [Primulina eburnea]|uniref:uncharacterized protein n=1 Tax=Primulina eburnea TaxID=1245227 RepID=UPI003C6C7B61
MCEKWTKYLYSCDNKDNKVHGWASNDQGVGMWMITLSHEFKNGGPLKQDYLTSHVGSTMLSPASCGGRSRPPNISQQNTGKRCRRKLQAGHINFLFQMTFSNPNKELGAVSGQLLVHDRVINSFLIKNVIPGTYSLFAWVTGTGTVGDYKHPKNIIVQTGSNIKLNNVVFEAPRVGPSPWEIGIPTERLLSFFIPNSVYKMNPCLGYTDCGLVTSVGKLNRSDADHNGTRQQSKLACIFHDQIHGLYHFYSASIAGSQLVDGANAIFLTQAKLG